MKKVTLLGFICLAVILTALPFMACAEEEPAPPVIPVTPVPVTPAPVTPAPVTPTPVTPAPAVPVTPTPAPVVVPTPAGEPVFAVMDPRSWEPPIEYIGINPRLDTLVGKKIGVANLMGGNAEALSHVAAAIMEAYPGCEAEYMEVRDRRDPAWLEWAQTCDAIILGNNY